MHVQIAVHVAWLVMELLTIVTKIVRGWASTAGTVVARGRAMMEEKDAEGWSAEDFIRTLPKAQTLDFKYRLCAMLLYDTSRSHCCH